MIRSAEHANYVLRMQVLPQSASSVILATYSSNHSVEMSRGICTAVSIRSMLGLGRSTNSYACRLFLRNSCQCWTSLVHRLQHVVVCTCSGTNLLFSLLTRGSPETTAIAHGLLISDHSSGHSGYEESGVKAKCTMILLSAPLPTATRPGFFPAFLATLLSRHCRCRCLGYLR